MPVKKKTSISKSPGRKKAVVPRAAGKSGAAGKAKPADKTKADKIKAAKAKPSLKSVVMDALDDMKALKSSCWTCAASPTLPTTW